MPTSNLSLRTTAIAVAFASLATTGFAADTAVVPATKPQPTPVDLPATAAKPAEDKAAPKWLTYKLSYAALLDYTAFGQDSTSISQVGKQDNQWEIRDFRVTLAGTMGADYKVGYQLAMGFAGLDAEPGERWNIMDLNFSFPTDKTTKIIVGKTKETFAYEMVSLAAFGSAQERVLSPFFVSRNVGVKVQHFSADKKMTFSAGVFNDWFTAGQSLSDSGTDVTARLTYLPQMNESGDKFLHLGIAGRYVGAEDGKIRYKGRPESNVADNFVDTGNLVADHAFNLGLESLWSQGAFSLLAEYEHSWLKSAANGDPQFSGYYLTGSYLLTGEHRPYDPTVGYTRMFVPTKKSGAVELVGRFSNVDLNDGPVQGGKFDKTYLGVNWWAQENWKVGIGWGHTWLDKTGQTGQSDSLLCRLQWVF